MRQLHTGNLLEHFWISIIKRGSMFLWHLWGDLLIPWKHRRLVNQLEAFVIQKLCAPPLYCLRTRAGHNFQNRQLQSICMLTAQLFSRRRWTLIIIYALQFGERTQIWSHVGFTRLVCRYPDSTLSSTASTSNSGLTWLQRQQQKLRDRKEQQLRAERYPHETKLLTELRTVQNRISR